MSQANILFIITDQQRWDTIGPNGNWCYTPHLDSIAREGLTFSQCTTTSPVCVPARVSLALGKYPHNFGLWQNAHFNLPNEAPNWMQAIRNAGYRTSVFGKTHLHQRHQNDLRIDESRLQHYGFDDVNEIVGPRGSASALSHMTALWEEKGLWDAYQRDFAERFTTKPHLVRPSTLPLEYYYDVYVGQQAKRYLQDYSLTKPWFCCVSFAGPHEPWDAPEPYASMYDPSKMPEHIARTSMGNAPKSSLNWRFNHSPTLSSEEISKLRANYAGNVTLIDDQIGEILETIKHRGEYKNTIVVFSSDHGEMNGDHQLIYKNTFLDGAVRVPLIIRTPTTAQSAVINRDNTNLVEWMDIGPTLVELAGGQLDYQQFGRSLCPSLASNTTAHRDSAIAEFRGEFMLMTQEWKLIVNRYGQPCLLYDRQNDKNEQRNLIDNADYSDTIKDLRLVLLDRIIASQNYSPHASSIFPKFTTHY